MWGDFDEDMSIAISASWQWTLLETGVDWGESEFTPVSGLFFRNNRFYGLRG